MFLLPSFRFSRRPSVLQFLSSARLGRQKLEELRASSTTTTNTKSGTASSDDVQIKAQFYVPKAERNRRNVYEIDYMVGETRLARNSRTCPTRELNFLNMQWHRHKSPYRKFRHMANLFRAAPFQRLLFPDLICISTIAGCLTYYNEFVAASNHAIAAISMSPSAFAGATTAIGLLAGFRLNNSYGRYREARQCWSGANNALRDLARQTLMWMNQETDHHHDMKRAQTRMLRLCQAFPITLMFHLNDKGCHHDMKRKSKPGEAPFKDRVQAEFWAELNDVYHHEDTELLSNDFDRLCRVKSQGRECSSRSFDLHVRNHCCH